MQKQAGITIEENTTLQTAKAFDWNLFGARLRSRREELGFLQLQVEQNTGMNRVYYRNWEIGEKTPGAIENLYNISILLKTDPRYFLDMSDIPDPSQPVYAETVTMEASAIAEIVDSLPKMHRDRILEIANLEKAMIRQCEDQILAKNRRILAVNSKIVGAMGYAPVDSLFVPETMSWSPVGTKPKAQRTRVTGSTFDWSKFAHRLRERREALGFTQQDIYENIGMHRSYYANWEVGGKTPNVLIYLSKVSTYLDADPRYFMGMIDTPNSREPIYKDREFAETWRIVEIVDALPLDNRTRMLDYARMEKQAAQICDLRLAKANTEIISVLHRLIEAVEETDVGSYKKESAISEEYAIA